MKPIAATLFINQSGNERTPEFDLLVKMDDGSEIKAGLWAKTRRDGTLVCTTHDVTGEKLPVYGGKFKPRQEDVADTQVEDPF
jgi:hypothetical protein